MKKILIYSILAFVLCAAFTVPDIISQIIYGIIGGIACSFVLFLTFKWRPVKKAEKGLQHLIASLITYGIIVTFHLILIIVVVSSRQAL